MTGMTTSPASSPAKTFSGEAKKRQLALMPYSFSTSAIPQGRVAQFGTRRTTKSGPRQTGFSMCLASSAGFSSSPRIAFRTVAVV